MQRYGFFGMVDISHTPAQGYMEIVPRIDAATLLPIINRHIAPGTEVWSDEWSFELRTLNRFLSSFLLLAHCNLPQPTCSCAFGTQGKLCTNLCIFLDSFHNNVC